MDANAGSAVGGAMPQRSLPLVGAHRGGGNRVASAFASHAMSLRVDLERCTGPTFMGANRSVGACRSCYFLRYHHPRLAQAIDDMIDIRRTPEDRQLPVPGRDEIGINPKDVAGLNLRVFKLPRVGVGCSQPAAARAVI